MLTLRDIYTNISISICSCDRFTTIPMTTSSYPLADNLKDAYRVCDVVPLQDEQLDRYYVDLSQSRKNNAIGRISMILEDQESTNFMTILFTGHRGCGKSTELRQIERERPDFVM